MLNVKERIKKTIVIKGSKLMLEIEEDPKDCTLYLNVLYKRGRKKETRFQLYTIRTNGDIDLLERN